MCLNVRNLFFVSLACIFKFIFLPVMLIDFVLSNFELPKWRKLKADLHQLNGFISANNLMGTWFCFMIHNI